MKPIAASIFLLIVQFSRAENVTQQTTSPKPSFFDMFSFRPHVTVSKFPPIIELIVQRVQAQFSNYVHEDLSRPQTYDRPVYTLAPDEVSAMENEEVISTDKPLNVVIIETFELANEARHNSTLEIEYEIGHDDGEMDRGVEVIGIGNITDKNNLGTFLMENSVGQQNFSHIVDKKSDKPVLVALTKVNHTLYANIVEVIPDHVNVETEQLLTKLNFTENVIADCD